MLQYNIKSPLKNYSLEQATDTVLVDGNGEEPAGDGVYGSPFIWPHTRAVVRFEWFWATQLNNPVSGSRYGTTAGASVFVSSQT
ncbi:hypothetical protein Y032_0668g1352 [Ancylostoma ceylanicum]|uniref:Uncharacterized protein n=1 Tax=Ancylostoma ceylanicum TaxID=53326 RepID=A0A016WIW3_9BILA|nr:hypothetical protein Y032_0668g1352 [Ancylostoma ceylanicum]